MIPLKLSKYLGRFFRDSRGSATVEFVIVFPVYLSMFLMSIELGLITMKNTLLERGLDIAVRDIRLGTGDAPTYDEVKETICQNAIVLYDCTNSLKLEMKSIDPYFGSYSSFGGDVDCVDKSEPIDPAVKPKFEDGKQNELMILRACYKYDPFFPDEFLGSALQTDGAGQAAIVSVTAFVQEPL